MVRKNIYRKRIDDDGVVLKAGDKVTEDKTSILGKRSEGTIHRTVESDQPLEKNPDDVLTMVIYNSPAEYQFNRQLYGYETNNGLYIEEQVRSLLMNVRQKKVFIV